MITGNGCISKLCRYLDCLAEEVPTALLMTHKKGIWGRKRPYFFLYDLLVNFSCGNIMVSRQSYVHIAFVVSEVEVDLPTVIEDINFT